MLNNSQRIIAIIPARGGSKGVPRKNIKLINGRPLIHYTLDAALCSKHLDLIVVSTDCEEIRKCVESQYSDKVRVCMRPRELATDTANVVSAIDYTLKTIESENLYFTSIVLLQPTSPLRNANDIDAAIKLLLDSDADSLVSVVKVEDAHPHRMYTQENGRLIPYEQSGEGNIRQSLPDVFHRNGAIYITHRDAFNSYRSVMKGTVIPYQMYADRPANIEHEIDFLLVELL